MQGQAAAKRMCTDPFFVEPILGCAIKIRNKKLLGAPGIATRSKKLLGYFLIPEPLDFRTWYTYIAHLAMLSLLRLMTPWLYTSPEISFVFNRFDLDRNTGDPCARNLLHGRENLPHLVPYLYINVHSILYILHR